MLVRGLQADVGSRPSPVSPGVAVGGYVVAWFAGQLLSSLVATANTDTSDDLPIPLLFVVLAVTWTIYLGMMWWLSQRHGTGDARRDYAVDVRWTDLAGIPIGAATQLLLVPLLYLPLEAIWPGTFDPERLSENAEDLLDRATGPAMALLIVMVVVAAPVVEELVYRGLIQRSLSVHLPAAAALVLAAAIFALVHFRPIEYPGLFAVGLVLGACVMSTGRLGMAIIAHMAFNAVGLAVAA